MNKILLVILLCYTLPTYAIDGADLNYTCLGNNNYEITLKVYHSCASSPMSSSPPLEIGELNNGVISNVISTVPIVVDAIYEQNQLAYSHDSSICQGGTFPGMTVTVFKQVITLPSPKKNWGIRWTAAATDLRTTTNLSTTNNLRIYAMINNMQGCYDAPVFTTRSNLRYNTNDTSLHFYNVGGVPSSNYQLRYVLQSPSSSTPVNYAAGLGVNLPLHTSTAGTFVLDANTGELSFSGTVGMAQKAATKVRLYMLDGADTLGFAERDMLITLDTTSNIGGDIQFSIRRFENSLYDSIHNKFFSCPGDTIRFIIDAYSPTGDTIHILGTNINLSQVFGPPNWSIFRQKLGSFPGRSDSVRFYVQIFIPEDKEGDLTTVIGLKTKKQPLVSEQMITLPISLGVQAVVDGRIVIDSNNNCLADSTESPYQSPLILEFAGTNNTHYLSTNSSLNCTANFDTGHYVVSVIPPNDYWTVCPDTQHIYVDSSYHIQQLDFVLQAAVQCPFLEVNATMPIARRCFNNTIHIKCLNKGTVDVNNAYLELELDSSLSYVGSTIPLVYAIGNKYIFNVGNLGVGVPRFPLVFTTVSCSSNLGDISSVTAHIYPDSICLPSIPNIQILDSCYADTVYFEVTNLSSPYDTTIAYWVLEDTTIVDTGSVHLGIGNTTTISYYTGGSGLDYQLILAPNSQDLLSASRTINCTSQQNRLSVYIPYNNIPYTSSWSIPIRGSYDPNDKQGFPEGIGAAHYIPSNTPLEYLIRFQNTGTDTAIFINILDTLPSNLDVSTLQMETSSHPYTWELMPNSSLEQSVLRITFDSIYLPDSNVNLAASNGFIQYTIHPKDNLANFETIENSASIYFDYNAPIKTNKTLHTICDNCLPIDIQVSTATPKLEEKPPYKVYPNPTQGQVIIEQETSSIAWAEIYSLDGKLLQTTPLKGPNEKLDLSPYAEGVYFLTIRNESETFQYKIVVVK